MEAAAGNASVGARLGIAPSRAPTPFHGGTATTLPITSFDSHTDALARLLDVNGPAAPRARWLQTLQATGESLGGHPDAIAALVLAWRKLYTLTLLLDHLQDGDPIADPWFASLPPALQYQLIFSAYVDAQQDLTSIAPPHVLHERLTRLHRHWASCVAQIAEGQYRDLTHVVDAASRHPESALDSYEDIIAQKAGATFALAFGGVAILATDDDTHIAAATNAGLIIGMLLQYQDDGHDAVDQRAQPGTLTFDRALRAAGEPGSEPPHEDVFWTLILIHYRQALTTLMEPLPPAVQEGIQNLVTAMFGPAPRLPVPHTLPEADT